MPFRDCAADEEQLTCFFQHAALPLYKYALHLTRSVSLAEDAVQTTFTQLVQYYDRVRGFDEGRLLAYAKKVLARQCGLLIKRQNMVVLLEEVSPRAAPQEPVVDFVERQATRAELLYCIERLKPRYRRILHMKYFENLSSEQIGRELGLQTAMKKARRRAQRRRWLHGLGRVAAGVAIVSGGLFAGAYLTVDATRNAVNNFVLEAFDGYAQMETEERERSCVAVPPDWDGPFVVTWVPERFTHVDHLETSKTWSLLYDDKTSSQDLSVFVWSVGGTPYISFENLELAKSETIQKSQANIYYNSREDSYMLLWTHNNYNIQIDGCTSTEEAIKIAENFSF